MEIRFLSLASLEVNDAVRWYEEQTESLSLSFLADLDQAIRLIKRFPLVAMEIEPEIRRLFLARFPYSIVYGIDGENVVVIALAHQQREPRYWVDRIETR